MLEKTFVLDTNVLLFDPMSVFKFGQNKVFIPLIVIEELDRFKKDQNENGRNARSFSRLVDNLRTRGPLNKGVELDSGGKLAIGVNKEYKLKNHFGIDLTINDNLILAYSMGLQEAGDKVTLITKDINLRLKADVLGIEAEDYATNEIPLDELYSGHRTLDITSEQAMEFERNRILPADGLDLGGIYPNEYMILSDVSNPTKKLLGRYSRKKGGIVQITKFREGIWGIYPKNVEQQFALDALLNPEINMVSLVGKAGTGKTLLAIAAGLESAIGRHEYSRVLVSRPIWPMGKDLGFLPGDVNEKLGPWMQPIFDNIDFLFGNQRARNEVTTWDELINQGLLHVEPLTYIRGRSLPSQFMIVDESQNLTPHEIKTIITRAGEGTKIILTGDCEQIDNPYLDSTNNGLAYCVDKLKAEEIVAHVSLKIGERSSLSEIASKLL